MPAAGSPVMFSSAARLGIGWAQCAPAAHQAGSTPQLASMHGRFHLTACSLARVQPAQHGAAAGWGAGHRLLGESCWCPHQVPQFESTRRAEHAPAHLRTRLVQLEPQCGNIPQQRRLNLAPYAAGNEVWLPAFEAGRGASHPIHGRGLREWGGEPGEERPVASPCCKQLRFNSVAHRCQEAARHGRRRAWQPQASTQPTCTPLGVSTGTAQRGRPSHGLSKHHSPRYLHKRHAHRRSSS